MTCATSRVERPRSVSDFENEVGVQDLEFPATQGLRLARRNHGPFLDLAWVLSAAAVSGFDHAQRSAANMCPTQKVHSRYS